MDKDDIIKKAVNKAYYNLTGIANLKGNVVGGYFGLIIPENDLEELINYADEIINQTFFELCNEIATKVTKDDMDFIMYKSFSFNNPSKNLIDDCFKIVNDIITNKKSSNDTTLQSLLKTLIPNYNKEEIEKSLDTIFDILLDYYTIIKK